MKVLPFTIPVLQDKSVIVKKENLPYFYTHLHRHEEIQITWIQEGEGTLIVGNNMHAFCSSEIYLLGTNMPHVFKSNPSYFRSKSKKKVRSLTIFFNPEGRTRPLFELPETKPVQVLVQKFPAGFKIPPSYFQEVSGCMSDIGSSSGLDQLIQFCRFLKSLCRLKMLEPLASNTNGQYVSDFEGLRIGAIYNYIIRHYNKEISLDDITTVAHMTPQSFCRYFKKHTGHTFISFLNDVRINEACKKLVGGGFGSIGRVAYDCGFNSITHFNRIFKKVKGQAPGEFVKKYTGNIN